MRNARYIRYLLVACFVSLAVCSAIGLRAAWRWPLVGDSALMRYVVFLIHGGHEPYTEIKDINLPGSYFFEFLSMKAFGWGAHGLRIYDGLLCGLICVLSWWIGRLRGGRAAAFGAIAGLLFLVIHLQDGLFAAGQRDLVLSVLMLGALGSLWALKDFSVGGSIFVCELLVGATLTVKPTLFPLALLPLFLPEVFRSGLRRRGLAFAGAGFGGISVAPLIMCLWLYRRGSLAAFEAMLGSTGQMHGELARRPAAQLLAHITAPVAVLFVGWIIVLCTRRIGWSSLRVSIFFCVFCGLVSYLEQGKGLAYQRYPFLAAALVLMLSDFAEAAEAPGIPAVVCAVVLAAIGIFFAPRLAYKAQRYSSEAPFQAALGAELESLGASGRNSVQCFDTYSGCINTLYDLRVVQATGYLYDCYLFQPPSRVRDAYREEFLGAFDRARPEVLVVTDQPCFGERGYDRLEQWPELAQRLNAEYALRDSWSSATLYSWWSRAERPVGFRVYTLR